ncbi:hypothetical protein SISSUDRAFT_1115956 [Sistotremastrum suecicum HHB10207 ss-3]|uniref:Chromatin assembly factor 1 subunit A dimerization domain-containing protein n=1 Tax=Sistotremastrum suecicum HHB10207 ss-3 TaxID=1314776 RepID=A0A166IWT4_9AGAM|nr:hypothetical protein SISSUDRAFT_1115956 [Sistotremastrum suecicum HHB10207 ss-3]
MAQPATMRNSSPISGRVPLAEIKNGKVLFKQKPMSLEKQSETLQEIVKFRELLASINQPLDQIPSEHLPLIAKLCHESDKGITPLVKAIKHELAAEITPSTDPSGSITTSDKLPISTLERAVLSVAVRTNYGVEDENIKIPAALCVWRWEVKDKSMLPATVVEAAELRRNERIDFKREIQIVLQNMDPTERSALLAKGPLKKDKNKENHSGPNGESITPSASQENAVEKPVPAKVQDPEKLAREQELLAQKTAKAEQNKKQEVANKKSAAILASFFKKAPKPAKASTSKAPGTEAGIPGPSMDARSDYQKTFHPFVVKKDVHMAPINWFQSKSKVIELDIDGSSQSTLQPRALLQDFLSTLPPSIAPRHPRYTSRSGFKILPHPNVRQIVNSVTEAEVRGDQQQVADLLKKLRNRRQIVPKTIVFADSVRPGYFGTWTRSSKSIGPRTPFAKDMVSLDYSYDSGEEWEEEGAGEEVADSDGSGPEDTSDVESDMDDWLVPDEEGVEMDMNAELPPDLLDVPLLKRKPAAETKESRPEKRRKVAPLVPFQKGPCWEERIGECSWDGFLPCRIQLFDDCPFPIDPFTYVSAPKVVQAPAYRAPAEPSTQDGFVVPALPDHCTQSHRGTIIDFSAPPGPDPKPKLPPPLPKTTFPAEHMQLLIACIQASSISSLKELLIYTFNELKLLGIKKNALEVKLREICEKRYDQEKKATVWSVRPEILVRELLHN